MFTKNNVCFVHELSFVLCSWNVKSLVVHELQKLLCSWKLDFSLFMKWTNCLIHETVVWSWSWTRSFVELVNRMLGAVCATCTKKFSTFHKNNFRHFVQIRNVTFVHFFAKLDLTNPNPLWYNFLEFNAEVELYDFKLKAF